jgi:precorrin-6B methylase 2
MGPDRRSFVSCPLFLENPFGEKVTEFMSRNATSALLSAWIAITLFLSASCSNQPTARVETPDADTSQPGLVETPEPVEPDVPYTEVIEEPVLPVEPSDDPFGDPAEMIPDPTASGDLPSVDLDSLEDLFFGMEGQAGSDPESESSKRPDVIFVPTPQEVVDRMLELAEITKDDLVYDLGCGDGRIVATAAKKFGCKAIGFDVDPQRIKDSLATVQEKGVEDLVEIRKEDIFTLDLSPASVITLYLLPELNVRLIPQLEKLKPGSRIVSHAFDMRGVVPDKVETVEGELGSQHTVYLWTTPLKKRNDLEAEDDF